MEIPSQLNSRGHLASIEMEGRGSARARDFPSNLLLWRDRFGKNRCRIFEAWSAVTVLGDRCLTSSSIEIPLWILKP